MLKFIRIQSKTKTISDDRWLIAKKRKIGKVERINIKNRANCGVEIVGIAYLFLIIGCIVSLFLAFIGVYNWKPRIWIFYEGNSSFLIDIVIFGVRNFFHGLARELCKVLVNWLNIQQKLWCVWICWSTVQRCRFGRRSRNLHLRSRALRYQRNSRICRYQVLMWWRIQGVKRKRLPALPVPDAEKFWLPAVVFVDTVEKSCKKEERNRMLWQRISGN